MYILYIEFIVNNLNYNIKKFKIEMDKKIK